MYTFHLKQECLAELCRSYLLRAVRLVWANFPELLEKSSKVSETSLNFPRLLENSSQVGETSLVKKSHNEPPGVNNGHNCSKTSKQPNLWFNKEGAIKNTEKFSWKFGSKSHTISQPPRTIAATDLSQKTSCSKVSPVRVTSFLWLKVKSSFSGSLELAPIFHNRLKIIQWPSFYFATFIYQWLYDRDFQSLLLWDNVSMSTDHISLHLIVCHNQDTQLTM